MPPILSRILGKRCISCQKYPGWTVKFHFLRSILLFTLIFGKGGSESDPLLSFIKKWRLNKFPQFLFCCHDTGNLVCSLMHAQLLQLCPTLCNPWTAADQAPMSLEFSRQEYGSGLPFPTTADLPDPGTELDSRMSPELAGRFFTTSATFPPSL